MDLQKERERYIREEREKEKESSSIGWNKMLRKQEQRASSNAGRSEP